MMELARLLLLGGHPRFEHGHRMRDLLLGHDPRPDINNRQRMLTFGRDVGRNGTRGHERQSVTILLLESAYMSFAESSVNLVMDPRSLRNWRRSSGRRRSRWCFDCCRQGIGLKYVPERRQQDAGAANDSREGREPTLRSKDHQSPVEHSGMRVAAISSDTQIDVSGPRLKALKTVMMVIWAVSERKISARRLPPISASPLFLAVPPRVRRHSENRDNGHCNHELAKHGMSYFNGL
jgi:hypothetical protein